MDPTAPDSGVLNKFPGARPTKLFECRFVDVEGALFAVALSVSGAEFFYMDGSETRLTGGFSLPTVPSQDPTARRMNFLRGVTVLQGDVYIGCCTGDIAQLSVSPGVSPSLIQMVKGHNAPIASLATIQALDFLASGDDLGVINVKDAQMKKVSSFPGDGFPATCLVSHGEILAAGYANGLIRLFRPRQGELAIEIAAHSRCITAMDIHPSKPWIVSVAEDTFMNVWSLPNDDCKDHDEVTLLNSSCATDHLLTGVQFAQDGSNRIIASSYDVDALLVWNRI